MVTCLLTLGYMCRSRIALSWVMFKFSFRGILPVITMGVQRRLTPTCDNSGAAHGHQHVAVILVSHCDFNVRSSGF